MIIYFKGQKFDLSKDDKDENRYDYIIDARRDNIYKWENAKYLKYDKLEKCFIGIRKEEYYKKFDGMEFKYPDSCTEKYFGYIKEGTWKIVSREEAENWNK